MTRLHGSHISSFKRAYAAREHAADRTLDLWEGPVPSYAHTLGIRYASALTRESKAVSKDAKGRLGCAAHNLARTGCVITPTRASRFRVLIDAVVGRPSAGLQASASSRAEELDAWRIVRVRQRGPEGRGTARQPESSRTRVYLADSPARLKPSSFFLYFSHPTDTYSSSYTASSYPIPRHRRCT